MGQSREHWLSETSRCPEDTLNLKIKFHHWTVCYTPPLHHFSHVLYIIFFSYQLSLFCTMKKCSILSSLFTLTNLLGEAGQSAAPSLPAPSAALVGTRARTGWPLAFPSQDSRKTRGYLSAADCLRKISFKIKQAATIMFLNDHFLLSKR